MPSRERLARLTDKKKRKFLEVLSEGYSVTKASDAAGLTRQRFHQIRSEDSEFAKAWDDAWERGADVFRDEVRDRALKGTKHAIVYKGQVTGAVRQMSDIMLIFATKARAPEFKDNSKVEINVGDRLNELADAIAGKGDEPEPQPVSENPQPE